MHIKLLPFNLNMMQNCTFGKKSFIEKNNRAQRPPTAIVPISLDYMYTYIHIIKVWYGLCIILMFPW